jgi:hypothetical protein
MPAMAHEDSIESPDLETSCHALLRPYLLKQLGVCYPECQKPVSPSLPLFRRPLIPSSLNLNEQIF